MLSACDATLGGVVTRVPSDPTSTHWGPVLAGQLHLPKSYGWFAGGEIAHLVQAEPKSSADQVRVNALVGLSQIARPEGSRWSPEIAARLGFFRGANGPLVSGGLLAGASVGIGFRLSENQDPWDRDGLLGGTFSLVPQIGANALVPELRFADIAPEIWGGLAVRVTLSSTLVP